MLHAHNEEPVVLVVNYTQLCVSPGPAKQNEKSSYMLKSLTGCPSLADKSRKEEKDEDKGEGEQVNEVLLAVEVTPPLQFHLAQLLPQLQ